MSKTKSTFSSVLIFSPSHLQSKTSPTSRVQTKVLFVLDIHIYYF